jgi:hypothetical protein
MDTVNQKVQECVFWWAQDCWIQSEPETGFEFCGQLVEAETRDGTVWGEVFYLRSSGAPLDCDSDTYHIKLLKTLECHLLQHTEVDEIRVVLGRFNPNVFGEFAGWRSLGYQPLGTTGWRKTIGKALPTNIKVPYYG